MLPWADITDGTDVIQRVINGDLPENHSIVVGNVGLSSLRLGISCQEISLLSTNWSIFSTDETNI